MRKETDLAWSLARMNLSNIKEGLIKQDCGEQQMPCWSAFNSVVTDEKVPESIIGFFANSTTPGRKIQHSVYHS